MVKELASEEEKDRLYRNILDALYLLVPSTINIVSSELEIVLSGDVPKKYLQHIRKLMVKK